MKRVAPVILTVTLVAGLAGGLLYTWVLDPIETYDASPDTLYIEDKLVYLAMIGDLYADEGDLAGAEARLAELNLEADGPALAELIEGYLDRGGRPEEMRNLARLAGDLGASGGVLMVFAAAPMPTAESTPADSTQTGPLAPGTELPGPSPTPAPTVTPAPSYRLIEQTAVCAEPGQPGRIAVQVHDATGNGLAGVEIVVTWSTGQDRFFTGLRPEQGRGYADFDMEPRIEYDVSLASFKGEVAQGLTSDLSSGVCPTDTMALDWRVTFQEVE
jgi:hypothetical protein